MTEQTPQVVRSYVDRLEAALTGLPEGVRAEILGGVREELVGLDPAAAAARIELLGDPAFIAAEAREQAGELPSQAESQRTEPLWYVVVTGLLVSFGGIIVPVVGWVVGLVMMWLSRSWWRWEKWLATVLMPLTVILFNLVTVLIRGLSRSAGETANPLLPTVFDVAHSSILLAIVGNVVVGLWLIWRARRAPRPRP